MATRTWAALATGSASTATNWSLTFAPSTGDVALFTDLSVENCSWDILEGLSAMIVNSAFTGSINLIVAFSSGQLLFETT